VIDGAISDDSNDVVDDVVDNTTDTKCVGFTDVTADSSYCDAVTWAKNKGIFTGYSDGTFKLYQPINRVEVLKVVLEAMNISILASTSDNFGFDDVEIGAWYMPYINTGKMFGIFDGDSGKKTARPSDVVNRVEALKLLFEALRTSKGYALAGCNVVSNYPDATTDSWYYNYACASKQYTLVDGSYLYPSALSTRGEIVEMLYRLSEAGIL
jgi:hypothetical protein